MNISKLRQEYCNLKDLKDVINNTNPVVLIVDTLSIVKKKTTCTKFIGDNIETRIYRYCLQ